MKKLKIALSLVLAALALSACAAETAETSGDATSVIEESPANDVEKAEVTAVTSENASDSEAENSETESEYDVVDVSGDDTSEDENEVEVTAVTEEYFENSFEVYLYQPEKDGSYTFTHSGSDDVPWDIYVLDEKFSDGYRYLYSNYTPDATSDCTIELKAGQFVYCICTENEWNSQSEADSQLSIIAADNTDDSVEDNDENEDEVVLTIDGD